MASSKKKPFFDEAAKFNWKLDANAGLKQKPDEFARPYTKQSEKEYRGKLLLLFWEEANNDEKTSLALDNDVCAYDTFDLLWAGNERRGCFPVANGYERRGIRRG